MSLNTTLKNLKIEADYFGLEKLSAALDEWENRRSSVELLTKVSPLFGLGRTKRGTMFRVRGIVMTFAIPSESRPQNTNNIFTTPQYRDHSLQREPHWRDNV